MKKSRSISPFTLFLVLLLGGLLASTWVARRAQRLSMSPKADATRGVSGELCSTQKAYLDAQRASSELLFKLAFGALGALLGLRLSEKTGTKVAGHGPFAAAALLLVSIYSAFLLQTGISFSVEGPPEAVFGPVLTHPILLQFWSLFGAVLILALALFRPTRAAKVAAALCLGLLMPASAQEAKPPEDCIQRWSESRGLSPSAETVADMNLLVERVASRRELSLENVDRCELSDTVFDAVRFSAITDSGGNTPAETNAALTQLFRDTVKAAENPTFSPGQLLEDLLSVAQIWKEPSGIVDVDGRGKTLFISIIDPKRPTERTWKGYTRWLIRLPPGSYELTASEGGRRVDRRRVEVKDGDRVALTLGAKP